MKELERFIKASLDPKFCCEMLINELDTSEEVIEQLKELYKSL